MQLEVKRSFLKHPMNCTYIHTFLMSSVVWLVELCKSFKQATCQQIRIATIIMTTREICTQLCTYFTTMHEHLCVNNNKLYIQLVHNAVSICLVYSSIKILLLDFNKISHYKNSSYNTHMHQIKQYDNSNLRISQSLSIPRGLVCMLMVIGMRK